MEPIQPYVVELRDRGWRLIGPFESLKVAAAWGEDRKNNPDDDPRWQVIELTPTQARSPLPQLEVRG